MDRAQRRKRDESKNSGRAEAKTRALHFGKGGAPPPKRSRFGRSAAQLCNRHIWKAFKNVM